MGEGGREGGRNGGWEDRRKQRERERVYRESIERERILLTWLC